jgi:hypothetical protein
LCVSKGRQYTAENNKVFYWYNGQKKIILKGYKTVNMLGCHDGIPVLDLKGKLVNGVYNKALLEDSEIEGIMSHYGKWPSKKIFMIHLGTRLLSSQRNIFLVP